MSVSFKTLANDEIGIRYNHVSRVMDKSKVYEQGRYALNPGETFFKFKRTFVTLSEPNLECLSLDGLTATLSVTFQYRLVKDQLINFFLMYGKDYENTIRLLAVTATINACGNWTSEDFFYHREDVQQSMLVRVQDAFAQVNIDAGFYQLSNVELASAFQDILQAVQAAKQDSDQATNERQQNITQATTLVLQAEQDSAVYIVNANATAAAILAEANAGAQGITAQLQAQSNTYASIMTLLNLSPEDLINYISIQTIQNSANPIVAVQSPANFAFSSNATSN